MRAGLLTEQIVVLRPSATTSDYGDQTMEYGEYYTTRARVVHNSGNRAEENGEILHNYTKTIEVYRYVDVIETDWIKFKDNNYRILSIEDIREQNKKVLTVELVND